LAVAFADVVDWKLEGRWWTAVGCGYTRKYRVHSAQVSKNINNTTPQNTMKKYHRPRRVLHHLRNWLGKPFGRISSLFFSSWSSASAKLKTPSTKMPPFHSMSDDGITSAKRNQGPTQRRGGRGTTPSTVAMTESSAAELEKTPLINPHRCTSSKKSRRRPRAMEEHHSYEDVNDSAYQQFLEFLNSSSEPSLPPPQNSDEVITSTEEEGREGSVGFVADLVELHEELIKAHEVRGCRHEISTKKENTNMIERYVAAAVDEFEITLDEGDEDASLSIPELTDLQETDILQFTEKDTCGKDVDSAMAWCALAVVLGSHAPSCVTKNTSGKIKGKEPLWEINTTIGEDMPDLHSDDGSFLPVVSPTSEGAPDLNDISFDGSEDDEDSLFNVPDVDDAQEFIYEELYQKTSVEDAANSTLAWSALALLLGAPPPASVTRKTRNISRFSDDASNEVIPILH